MAHPALAVLGKASTKMLTSSNALAQAPPGMVHRKTFRPVERFVTVEFAKEGFVTVDPPEITDQAPPETAVAASWDEAAHMV
jgi:hypothetical protein